MKKSRSQRQVAWAFDQRAYTSGFALSLDHPNFDEELVIRDAEDPFDIVARIEEEQMQINQRNLNGKRKTMTLTHSTPRTAVANAIAPLKNQIVYARRVGMDPAEILEAIESDRLRADLGSSVAWSIDMAIVFRAQMVMTELYKIEYDGNVQTKEVFENFMNDFLSIYDERNQDVFDISENGKQMLVLMGLRQQYHDITGKAMARQLRVYNPPSLKGLVLTSKPRQVTDNDRALIEAEVKMMKEMTQGMSDDDAKAMLADILIMEQRNFEQQHKDRKRWDRIVMEIIDRADTRAEPTEFYDLSDAVQGTLLTQMLRALDRAQAFSRRVCKSVTEYMPVAKDAFTARKAIEQTMVSLRDKAEEAYINAQKRMNEQGKKEAAQRQDKAVEMRKADDDLNADDQIVAELERLNAETAQLQADDVKTPFDA